MNRTLSLLVLLALFLAACSPSVDTARQVYMNTESRIKDGTAVLDSFEKTNGQTMEGMGQKVYVFHYSAVLRCVKDEDGWFLFGEPCTKGKTIRDGGSMYFRQSERGWIGSDGKVY